MGGYLLIILISATIYFFERKSRSKAEEKNQRLQDIVRQLDEQARIIVKTDFALNKAQDELDKKITGLYTLHELGKKINSTLNIEDLFTLINQPFVSKLGFSRALIMLKDTPSDNIMTKTSIGYSATEIKQIENELNKDSIALPLLKKGGFLLVDRHSEKIEHEELFSKIFKSESFLTVPIVEKDEACGFILMGNPFSYTKLTKGDAELLSVLANQVGTAIENTGLYTELFNSHQDLERRVKERTIELGRLNEELKRLNKVKSDFVSAVSHELRTPLTSIKGYASILMTGKLGEVSAAQKERLEKIDKHSNNLVHLINNLLDIARIESGMVQMDIKEISIKEMLDSIIDVITPQIKEKGISLKVTSKIKIDKIKADPTQLERVFLNLLSNAAKFTPEKGKVTIYIEEKDDFVKFVVEDTGIGIPDKDIEKVFEEFFRADNASDQQVKGTGLGLSLVKKIIEAHKGKIYAESKLGKGTKFSFTIPRY
ncbi:MAG: GAF domain-containing sensor histidine kinase [Candidatus Omnitrophica bacterium]|nr:GAF domain-containing sensor histidine kinase [Candidatus Omnitrophota bacterium]